MKGLFLTDKKIEDLLAEPKQIDCSAGDLLRSLRPKSGRAASFLQTSHKFARQNNGESWLIYIRRNINNPLDFSCGIGLFPEGRQQAFLLRRYNGKSHQHTNWLDKSQPFYDFHIHQATEQYQNSSYYDEHYATPTDRYAELAGAFKCLLEDCCIVCSDNDKQMDMFS